MSAITLGKTLKIKDSIQGSLEFIHVIIGPRQVGKSTAARQICAALELKSSIISADSEVLRSPGWLRLQWNEALHQKLELLVIDEIQKVENWASVIKELWDQNKSKMKLLLLGSSSLEIHRGLNESLAGRYLLHKFFHWNLMETKLLHTMSLDDYLVYGGYPGSYQLLDNKETWLSYLKESIVAPVIGKDILSMVHVKSPALFRQCFEIICSYGAQEISYTKLLGQLQDRGNTDLVKHYIELFEAAFLIKSLFKYSEKEVKKRSSSPKIIPLCPALYSITKDADLNTSDLGRSFEIAVGAYLSTLPGKLFYWREGHYEVDYVYQFGKKTIAIEVKYGKDRSTLGLEKFLEKFPKASSLLISSENFNALLSGQLL